MSLAAKRAERSGGDAHALLDDRVAVEVGDHRIAPVSLAQLLAVELVNDQVVLAWRRQLLRDLPPESALWRQLRVESSEPTAASSSNSDCAVSKVTLSPFGVLSAYPRESSQINRTRPFTLRVSNGSRSTVTST